ncbi:MAG: DUF1015 domain-containing protein [Nitrospinota bacterium]
MSTFTEPNITPLRGLRYDAAAGPLENLLAPPYDVIKPDMQENLYKKSEYNIVRLILGKKLPDDNEQENRYSRAAATLNEWIANSILVREGKPAIYVYAQTFDVFGEKKTRVGFIARKRLEEFGGSVHPHEKTLSGPKTDRLNLTRACKCNFSQIFGIYTEKEKVTERLLSEITKNPPDMEAVTEDSILHRIWAVTDEEWIKSLSDIMQNKNILIADGHHRYETALNYLRENSSGTKTPEDLKYVMMYFTNTESEGLTVFPTHRVIHNVRGLNLESFFKNMKNDFDIEKLPSANGQRNESTEQAIVSRMKNANGHVFGLYSGNGNYSLLTYKPKKEVSVLDKLDVGVLHGRLLEPILGIGAKELAAQSNVSYTIDVAEAAARVDSGSSQLAFFLNSTPVEQMRDVAEAGLTMPQKSTYFYPKLISGLVINPLF